MLPMIFGMLIEMKVFTTVIDAIRAHEGRAFGSASSRCSAIFTAVRAMS